MKTIGIYPGNFQPAHRGHVMVYKQLRSKVGPEVFVITTDRTPTPDAPLNFGEKENIWVRHGVPASNVVKVNDWQNPSEVFSRVSPTHTTAIFALSQKQHDELAKRKGVPQEIKDSNQPVDAEMPVVSHEEIPVLTNKETWLETDGQPSYFQPYKGNERTMAPLEKHGYVIVVDDSSIDGKPISTANVREGLGSEKYTEQDKKRFFKWAFGWFDIGLFQLLQDKFRSAHKTAREPDDAPVSNIVPTSVSESVKGLVDEVIQEFMSTMSTPQGEDEDSMTSIFGDSPGAEARNREVNLARQDAAKKKSAAERELKSFQADVKWKEADLKRKKSDEMPNKRREIDLLNKQISMAK